jgi:hypothetical protein
MSRAAAWRLSTAAFSRNTQESGEDAESLAVADSSAAIARLNDHVGRHLVRIDCFPISFAGRSVQFMAVGAFAMKNCSSVAAPQQPFADTASALVAHIKHK